MSCTVAKSSAVMLMPVLSSNSFCVISFLFMVNLLVSREKFVTLSRCSHLERAAKLVIIFNKTKYFGDNFQFMAKILDRIKTIADMEGITIGALERSIGASKGVLSRAIDKGTDIQAKWIVQIVENYPQYSTQWLLTGKGDIQDNTPAISMNPIIGTPYFDVDFIGGFTEIFNSQTSVPACNVLVPGFEKASLWCNVTGHSMEPRINHGDIIALRECTINDIQFGEIYAVVLDTIRTIKIIRRGSIPTKLLYVPINKPDYEEQEFDISRIIKIFEVIGAVSKFF